MSRPNVLALGDHLPDFQFEAGGQQYSPENLRHFRFLVILFLDDACHYVQAWKDRIVAIGQEYGGADAQFLGISPGGEPQDYPFPTGRDSQGKLVQTFGASHTPEVFVFDQAHHLRYHGAVDSDFEESAATAYYLRDALNRLSTRQSVFLPETPLVGCPIAQ